MSNPDETHSVDNKVKNVPLKKKSVKETRLEKIKKLTKQEKKVKYLSKKYKRGEPSRYKNVEDKKLRNNIRKAELKIQQASELAARAEVLLPAESGYIQTENPLEATWKVKQHDIYENVDVMSSSKIFDLHLTDHAPYVFNYSRNGRYILLGGEKGHMAHVDWHKSKSSTEFYVNENVNDVQFLHNETMFAVAQKKYVYIYDKQGVEIHRLKNHLNPHRLEFLPFHFLLASVGKHGILRYQDTSTGSLVAEWKTQLGHCYVMKQNPQNAIIHLGHHNGSVTLWNPTTNGPLVKMLCHRGPVSGLVIDRSGHAMITSGEDGLVNVWDLRTYKKLRAFYSKKPVEYMDISQRGLLATSNGCHIQLWKDFVSESTNEPYMLHKLPMGGHVRHLQFCPFEDVLGIGHDKGFSSIIIPGAGEANFDTFEANPYETKKQRRETTVVRLLEKIQPEMITLDTDELGKVVKTEKKDKLEHKKRTDFRVQKFKRK